MMTNLCARRLATFADLHEWIAVADSRAAGDGGRATGSKVHQIASQPNPTAGPRANGRIFLNRRDLRDPVAELDISEHLRPGNNVIRYTPIGDEGSASASVAITD